MSLLKKYELLYQKQEDVCGEPFSEFSQFAKGYANPSARVLDLGCGQGRDAFIFAREGMQVTGVDISPTGIQQMLSASKAQNLPVEGVVSNILDYSPDTSFDVILLDRTLHMLSTMDERLKMLESCASWLKDDGHLLIADETSNLIEFKQWFEDSPHRWTTQKGMKKGFCFVQLTEKSLHPAK